MAGIHWIYPFANHETFLYCIRCEGHLTSGQRVAVIGSGVATAEIALMLRERYGTEVVILTTGEPIGWGERRGRLLSAWKIEALEERLVDVQGTDKGATLHSITLEGGRTVEVQFALVAMGLHKVYNELARSLGVELEQSDEPEELRHVLVNGDSETSIPGLFAVGDMTRHNDRAIMKQVYTAQEYAVRALDLIDRRRRNQQREKRLS